MQWASPAVFLWIILSNICHAETGTVERIYIRDNKPAIKGSNIQLVCEVSQFSNSDVLHIYQSDSRLPSSLAGINSKTQCSPSLCLTTDVGRYTFSADNSNVYINISSVNRSEDQKWWTCVIANQRQDMLLNVITVPTSLQYENPPSQDQDLAMNAVQLKCSTGCSYPQPSFSWFYSESNKDSLQTWLPSGSASDTTTGCSDSDRKYSSTLSFPRNTTFPGNIQTTVKFKCSILSFTGMSQPLYTSYSTNIQFAVQVSSATLKDGSSTISGQLQVVSGVSKTLTCETSVSRPAATIVWYIGTQEKQRSTSKTFTVNPQNSDHNEMVYCKAFNTQPESQAVISYMSRLYVTVYATTPTLTNKTTGSMILLENDSVSMECITSATRPAATVTWWKGSSSLKNIQNTNINKGNLISVKSVVSFTPRKADDRKVISCQSFVSGQDNRPSVQQNITVYWPPVTPFIPTSEFPFLENQTGKSINCFSQDYGNPVSTARWKKQYGIPDNNDSRRLNLPTMTSQMDGSFVSCQLDNYFTQVKGSTIKSPSAKLKVEYNPIAYIMVEGMITKFVTRNEGQTLSALCNATGNPTPTVKWIGQSPSSSNLTFHDIDRSNHGRYTCRAEATSEKFPNHDFITETTIDVIVNYAPNVKMVVSKADATENISLKISCNATGRPSKYNFTSIVQTLEDKLIPNTHLPEDIHFNGLIDIPKLQLEDSGTYTCHVNNGIPDRNQQLDQIGKTDISVKVSPKVLLEDDHTFTGTPGKPTNITIPFFSYPAIKEVNFEFLNGTEIRNSNKYKVSYTRQNVTAKFYDQHVQLEGYVAILEIKDYGENLYNNYTLVLGNDIGQPLRWNVRYIVQSIPYIPRMLYYIGKVDGLDNFLFVGNFNGGLQQRFIIETKAIGKNTWIEQLRFNETDDKYLQNDQMLYRFKISGMIPGDYEIRVLAGNDVGWIPANLAPITQFTVFERENKECIDKLESDNTAAVVGGSLSAVIVGILIASAFMMRKMISYKQPGTKSSEYTESSMMYDSLQTQQTPNSTYSTLTPETGTKQECKYNTYENMKTQDKNKTTML